MFVFVIRKIREEKNMSLYELAKKCKMSRSYLTELEENKKINPSLKTMYNISKALNVNIKDLFYTEIDIETLRNKMHYRIEKYGLNSKEVLEISQLIDLLINLEMAEK